MAARECFEKVFKASTWKWDGGSRPFFWRWGEFTKEARDGAGTFVQGELPRCTDKQSVPKDARTKALVQSKVADVRAKGYIGKGEDKVVSVTSFFDVPKGTDDIRMVYNATSSGLNGAVWAPWFSLPTVDSHLQAVDPGTFMGDCDISEMFLNFMLDKAIRPYAGVDLTRLFPNEAKDGSKRLWENWTRMLMGYKPSPYITTQEICRQQPFLVGDRRDPQNVFRWSKVILNLPGKDNYNPARPRVYKVREDQTTIAADLFVYIDDVRNTAPSEVEGWKGAHQVCCRLGWLGIQDAARKRNYPSVTPRAWAGTIIHSDNNAVTVLVSEEKWGKTKDWINWVLERVNDKAGILHKELERCRGFLIYVSRTYTSFKPYLRGLHKTIDSWRPGRDDDGWKICWEIMAAKERGDWELLNTQEPDEYVKPVKRLRQDFEALAKMTRAEAPPKVIKRRGKVGKAFYGFGDASGDGYGFALEVEGKLLTEFGTWKAGFENKHSNFKELFNLVNAVETAYAAGSLKGCELFIFTDNFVAESSYYNGGSNQNKELDDLVFRLWDIQMNGDFTLFIYHVAGTRMIQSGVDGLSRGDKAEGIALGRSIASFIPIHLSPMERSDKVEEWVRGLWNEEEQGELILLSPEGWYDMSMKKGAFLWDVAPAAGEAAVEQLCIHVHGRPENTHLFIIPRLCTCHWRKQLGKACDILLNIEPIHDFWNKDMHEPFVLGIYLPLLPSQHAYRPWRFKYTSHVGILERQMRGMQLGGGDMDWSYLRQFLLLERKVSTVPHDVAREMLQTKG